MASSYRVKDKVVELRSKPTPQRFLRTQIADYTAQHMNEKPLRLWDHIELTQFIIDIR